MRICTAGNSMMRMKVASKHGKEIPRSMALAYDMF